MSKISMYDIENIKTRIKGQIELYEKQLEAWNHVTRNRKKDGSDFANFNKNFNNAELDKGFSAHYLKTYNRGMYDNFASDEIYIDHPAEGYMEYSYPSERLATIDEVFKIIERHKADLRELIIAMQSDLDSCDTMVVDALETIDNALKNLKDTAKTDSIVHQTCELVRSYYGYYY